MKITLAIPRKVQSVMVSFNDHNITEFAFPQEWQWQEFVVQLPAEYIQDINEMTFRYVYSEIPEDFHTRGRHGSSVAFKSIVFEKS